MTLLDQLNSDYKTAFKAGDKPRKSALNQVLAALKQAALDQRTVTAAALHKKQGGALTEAQLAELEQATLTEAEVMGVLQKEAKARRESIADAQKAGRADLVAANEAELVIIESYLPQMLTRAELETLVRAAMAEAGATDLKGVGAVMKLLAPRTKGRADGKLVSDLVRELLGTG